MGLPESYDIRTKEFILVRTQNIYQKSAVRERPLQLSIRYFTFLTVKGKKV